MSIKATDFTLPSFCIQDEYTVFEIIPAREYVDGQATGKVVGYDYEVMIDRLRSEKVRVRVIQDQPIAEPDDVLDSPIKVTFDKLEFYPSHYNNRWSCKATASNVQLVKSKPLQQKKETN